MPSNIHPLLRPSSVMKSRMVGRHVAILDEVSSQPSLVLRCAHVISADRWECAVSGKWPSRGIDSLPCSSFLHAGMRTGRLEQVQPLCSGRFSLRMVRPKEKGISWVL